MVFDGDCKFCGLWIRRWRQLTGEEVDYLPFQDPQIAARFPEIPRNHFETSVQLIGTDGNVVSGAEAVFQALALNPKLGWPIHFYDSSRAFAKTTEAAYRFVAGHRMAFSRFTRLLWGRHVEWPDYTLTRWVFLRGLGLVYLFAFISLWTQIGGLIGHNGIMPADEFISSAGQQCDLQGIGLDRFHIIPTLCWVNVSDGFLQFQCIAGVVLSVLLILGIAPVAALVLLWVFYLSLTSIGGVFLEFQWDNLLLEAGFLSIFLAPLQLWPGYLTPGSLVAPSRSRLCCEAAPSRLAIWLLRILLFKLMFSSGCVKLASHDPAWRNFTALEYHYHTQPLPTWMGWYAAQSPVWFLKLSCVLMFAIELGAPFLFFMPRRIRMIGGGAVAFLQILILLSGNYGFFNWLTLALCVLLLDDFVLERFVRRKATNETSCELSSQSLVTSAPTGIKPSLSPGRGGMIGRWFGTSSDQRGSWVHSDKALRMRWPWWLIAPVAVVFIAVSVLQIVVIFGVPAAWFGPVTNVAVWISPFRTVNNYGLFAVMTTQRHEIIVQGSDDGVHWRDYEFKYKPGDVKIRPKFVAPFMPRLDWQMWFAALGDYQNNPWFENFCVRLLQGSPRVLALLAKNPFPQKPPRYIRAEVYNYEFTNFAERRASGAWWKREFVGEYLPPVSIHE